MKNLLRALRRRSYARGMAGRRSFSGPVPPEPRLVDLDRWAGMWIAVKDGDVIAAAYNSRDLVPMVTSMGERGRGAVAQFVPQPSDDIVIGVG